MVPVDEYSCSTPNVWRSDGWAENRYGGGGEMYDYYNYYIEFSESNTCYLCGSVYEPESGDNVISEITFGGGGYGYGYGEGYGGYEDGEPDCSEQTDIGWSIDIDNSEMSGQTCTSEYDFKMRNHWTSQYSMIKFQIDPNYSGFPTSASACNDEILNYIQQPSGGMFI